MFFDFLHFMRRHGLKVSLTEWMTLMQALAEGLADTSLMGFYHLCRHICVKREQDFDLYDQCFAAYFHGVEPIIKITEQLNSWLANPIPLRQFPDEEKRQIKSLDFDTLRRKFEERLAEQKERHDGGSHWIGTGGTSPFGHSGYHPNGIRVGGESRNRSAVQIASERHFKNLRHDIVIDVRQIGLALSRLKRLSRDSGKEELNLEDTVKKTGDNAGDLSLVFQREKRNSVKLLLLMDVGGSMTVHARLSERIFSAAYASKHFRHFRSFYFHNCPYETLYEDMSRRDGIPTSRLLQDLDDSWHLIVVGDAAMNPYEILMPGGAIDWFHQNAEPGLYWLQTLRKKFPKSIWLNPEPENRWDIQSTQIIRSIFPMFPLTIDGLDLGIQNLRRSSRTEF